MAWLNSTPRAASSASRKSRPGRPRRALRRLSGRHRRGARVSGTPALAAALATLKTWLTRDAYPLWASAGADLAGGGFHDLLGLDGRPLAGPRRCRVQARQAF